MTSEEAKAQYNNIDFKAMNQKIVVSMMEIVQLPSPDEAHTLFHKVIERFTHDELAFLTCNHIAEKFRDILARMGEQQSNKPIMGSNFEEFFNNMKK